MTIKLFNNATNDFLGSIDEKDLKLLEDQLEEESSRDKDYFVDINTVELLAESGASPSLLAILRAALGESDGIDVRWEKL